MKNHTPLFILSIPLLILAWLFFVLFAVVGSLAIFIGRKQAFNVIYRAKEIL